MNEKSISALWRRLPLDTGAQLEKCVQTACGRIPPGNRGRVFFRADDVAVPGMAFTRLMQLFERYRTPLALAVVPAWLTVSRWAHLKALGQSAPQLWCWHQHGWRHYDHAREGKKQEFGDQRSTASLRCDLEKGRKRLAHILGPDFFPAFTPPWNRCGRNTLALLGELGYRAVSRSCNSLPRAPGNLPDFQVGVDLHTRKETRSSESWEAMLAELAEGLSAGCCGIMIHHQRMNDDAFVFLENLLAIFGRTAGLRTVGWQELAGG